MLPVFSRFSTAVPKCAGLTLALMLALAGCAGSLPPEIKRLPDRVEIPGVPFFRGNDYQSAPNAMAAMLANLSVQITPGLLGKSMKLPGGEERIEQSIQEQARAYGFVVYPLDRQFDAVLTQVAAGYPVLVRYADGMVLKSPRYGVLVGYNRIKQTVVLQAGNDRHDVRSFSSFTSAWESTGSWALLVQGPRQLPANVDRERWLKAANDLAQAGQEQAAGEAVKTLNAKH
jgi:hypothetical protein